MTWIKLKGMRGKKARGLLLGIFAVILLAFIGIIAINAHVKAYVRHRILSPEEASGLNADCILVLGAGVWEGGRPSHMLHDRLVQGIELYRLGASERLLMSGDHGRKDYDEVNVMKGFAVDREVPSQHVFMDHAGFSTYESMYRARDVFQAQRIIVVTQRYHLYRALYVADKLGLDAWGVPSDPRPYARQEYREIREILARTKDFLHAIRQPEPTYLGEAIPVAGDGDLTND